MTKHFFLHCQHYTNIRKVLLNTLEIIENSILNIIDDDLIEILLFGNCKFGLEITSSETDAPVVPPWLQAPRFW